jgi:hypothetical protein
MFGVFVLTLITINVSQSFINKQNRFDLRALISIAFADGESGPKILQKIKSTCNCYNSSGQWVAISITACEDYVWQPPMAWTTCTLTSCPPGSSCR